MLRWVRFFLSVLPGGLAAPEHVRRAREQFLGLGPRRQVVLRERLLGRREARALAYRPAIAVAATACPPPPDLYPPPVKVELVYTYRVLASYSVLGTLACTYIILRNPLDVQSSDWSP